MRCRKRGSKAKFRAALLRKLPFSSATVAILSAWRWRIRSEPSRYAETSFESRAALPVTADPEKSGAMMRTDLLRFNGAVERDPAIDAWMKEHSGELGAIAHLWFEVMRKCGDEVREL